MIDSILAGLAAASPDPCRSEAAFASIAAVWQPGNFSLEELAGSFQDGGSALAHLLGVSSASAAKLARDPGALLWLAQPEIHDALRGPRRMRAEYDAAKLGAFDPSFRVLRKVKAREMLRIALREVAGWSSVEQSTMELTHLAQLCVQIVCGDWLSELGRRWTRPATEFAVLGMGKFGGEELNYSSDIDVIFFYGEEGEVNPRFSYREFFTRFAEKIIAAFTASDPAGALFRIDLRLRPEGASGPLVRSLDAMEEYYSSYGETWERMALIKGRVVAGSEGAEELGYEFTHRLQPFIYPKSVSLDVVEEIRAIKGRIEREIVGSAKLRRNVKLGYGGIREIEFVVQTLQILHGARHTFLQERNTIKALSGLQRLDIISREDIVTLIAAYRFLRTVEHRLQIDSEAQTHTLPEGGDELARIAASLGLSQVAFAAGLECRTNDVRRIFDRVLASSREAPVEIISEAACGFFGQPESAIKVLAGFRVSTPSGLVSPRTRRIYARLEPLLLDRLRAVADPDAALNRFARFVERYGLRSMLFETLLRSPRLLELLIRLFDASEYLAEAAIRRPQLIDEIARGGGLREKRGVERHLAHLAENTERLIWSDWLRAYKTAQVLRIGLRDLLGFASLDEVQWEYSALAEACLLFTQERLGHSDRFTVVALGKFGGRELLYGADLDVVFIGAEPGPPGDLIRSMSARTGEGAAFAVDARLRPEGENGQLALPLPNFMDYFDGRAQFWEAQALTRARAISGPARKETEQAVRTIWTRFGQRDDLFEQVAGMHARIVRERAGSNDASEFKTGAGGIMQVEFYVQARQMRSGIWEPNTGGAMEALASHGVIHPAAAAKLWESYAFLRRIESVLRRMDGHSISSIPQDELAQRRLAIRCGFRTREALLEKVTEAREEIARLAAL